MPRFRQAALGAFLAFAAATPALAKPDTPARAETAALAPADLADFDLVPPELVVSLADLAAGTLVPPPKSVVVRATGLVLRSEERRVGKEGRGGASPDVDRKRVAR